MAPLCFNPERWYKYPDLIKDRSAYAPFLTGKPYLFDFDVVRVELG